MNILLAQSLPVEIPIGLEWWQYIAVVILASPVVLSFVQGISFWQQNRQKKELEEMQAERKNLANLINSVNATNNSLLDLIKQNLLSIENRDKQYIQTIGNLDKTVGEFADVLKTDSSKRNAVYDSMQTAAEAQTKALQENGAAMQRLSETHEKAVVAMEQTSGQTNRYVEEIKTMMIQLSTNIETWGMLYRSAITESAKSNQQLASLETSINDLMGLVQSEIGKVLLAVDSNQQDSPNQLDKENIL